jgi:two-component system sensor histidine kinase/response regulator
MKEKSKDKTGDYVLMFQEELVYYVKTVEILNSQDVSKEELIDEFRQLSQKYHKLILEIMKITRIGDMNYKRLMKANDQIQQQKNELQMLNRKLQIANAAKDKIYSIIGHDMKNLLQVLMFSSELLGCDYENGKLEEDSIIKYIEKVLKTVENMSELLENLLQWARSQSGEIECRPRQIDLFRLATKNIEYLRENAEKKHIRLILEIQENTFVYADENMTKSVLRNLLSNAVKFTYSGGVVKVFSKEKGDFIVTSIADNGIGISKAKIETLFEIGGNESTTGTANENGTGLGLPLCKEFVEKNGGRIHVKSTPGQGSIFEFTLPGECQVPNMK